MFPGYRDSPGGPCQQSLRVNFTYSPQGSKAPTRAVCQGLLLEVTCVLDPRAKGIQEPVFLLRDPDPAFSHYLRTPGDVASTS